MAEVKEGSQVAKWQRKWKAVTRVDSVRRVCTEKAEGEPGDRVSIRGELASGKQQAAGVRTRRVSVAGG